MIRSKLDDLRRKKSHEEKRKITLRVVADESGVSLGSVHRLSEGGGFGAIHTATMDSLCRYFKLSSLCELIEFVPDEATAIEPE